MLGATIAGGVGALGSAIYGAIASSKENKKAQQLIQQQRDDNRAWYNARMSQDYTQRSDAQAVINKQRELLDQQYKNAAATNAVMGGSDTSLAAQKAAANDAMAQTMSDIASNAASYKDSVEQQYRAQDAALNQQQAQIHADQAKATAQAAAQAVGAGISLMGQGLAATPNAQPAAPGSIQLTPQQQAQQAQMNADYKAASAAARNADLEKNTIASQFTNTITKIK